MGRSPTAASRSLRLAARQPKFPNCKLCGADSANHPGIAAVPQGRSRKPASTAKSKGPQGVPSPVASFALSLAAGRRPPLLINCFFVFGIRGLPAAEQIPSEAKGCHDRGPLCRLFCRSVLAVVLHTVVQLCKATHLPAHEKQGQCFSASFGPGPARP